MQKFLRILMLTALFLPFALRAQNTLTVADGTTTNANVPVYGLYVDDFVRCQTIYTSTMLENAASPYSMNGGTITGLTYYLSSPATDQWSGAEFVVNIKEVTANTLSGFLDMTDATTVYTGSLDATQTTMDITFTSPYTYQGGNLLIEIYNTVEGTYKSANFFGVQATGASWQGNNGSSTAAITGSVKNFIPKTTFTFTGGTEITCSPVQNLTVDALQTTPNSLTLTWADAYNTGATYTVYNMADNSVVQAGISAYTHTVTGLNANTEYTFGVEANCSSTDASAKMFTTARTACSVITSLPFTDDFESVPSGNYQMPFCWYRYTSAYTASSIYPYSYASNPYSGSRSLYFYGTTGDAYPDTMIAITPEFDVTMYPMSANRVTFWARMGTASNSKNIYVGTMTDPANPSTFSLVDSVLVSGNVYTKYTVPMTNATAPYVAFLVYKGTGTMYVDDVTLELMPSCLEISDLSVNGVTSSSITVQWTDNQNTNASYSIYVGENQVGTTSDHTYTINGLNPNTTYTIGVEANCSASDANIMYVNGKTSCAPEALPFIETFDASLASDECWRGASSVTADEVLNGAALTFTANNSWTYSSAVSNGLPAGHYRVNIFGTSCKKWMITPEIDLSNVSNPLLSFDAAFTEYSSTSSAPASGFEGNASQAFKILVSTNSGQTWTLASDIALASLASSNYIRQYVDLTPYNGQIIRIAFYAQSTETGGDNNLHVDNLSVGAGISCMPVTNLSASDVTAYGATLNWRGDANSYIIYNMADTSVLQTVNDTTVVINTLTPNTSYTLGVAANCGSDESPVSNVMFTTLVTCPVPTNFTATLTPGNGTLASLSWTEIGTAEAWQICLNGDTSNLIDATNNPLELTGLTPEQPITAQIRAYCDANDQSEWSAPITFTPTNSYLLTVNDGTTTNDYVPIYGYWCDNITKSQFIIPSTSLETIQYSTINALTFYASQSNVSWGNATFDVYVAETPETTVSALVDYSTLNQVYAGSLSIVDNKMVVTFATPYNYIGGNLMIGFLQTVSGSYATSSWYGVSASGASMGGYGTSISVRNFLPKTTITYIPGDQPDCLPVTGLTVSDITTNSATLTWNSDANSYNIYDMSDTSFVASVSTTTYTITGLNAVTNYNFGVRAVCGTEESDIRTVSFSTACATLSLPYTETFESNSGTRNCWTLVSNNASNIGGSYGMGFYDVNNRSTLRFSSYSNASDYNQYAYSPLMDVNSNVANVKVSVVYATYSGNDILNFGYITATDTVWDATDYTTAGSSDFQTYTAYIPSTAIQLACHYYGNYSFYAWIDSVNVVEMSDDYCYPVSNLSVTDATTSSITISWSDANNSGATYTVYDMSDNSVIATGLTTNSYVVTGLTGATSYTFGVAANCSATSEADIVTISAGTDCDDITTLPYNEGFETGLGCWSTVNGSSDGEPWITNNCAGISSVNPHSGNYVASSWSWNSYAMHANAWLISPKFVLPTTTDSITLSWWDVTNANYPDHYSVVLSTTTNDTAAFTTVIYPYSEASGTWTLRLADLSAYAGQSVYIAFHHVDYNENYLLIDDINMSVGGYVPPTPDTLTVTFSVDDATMGTTIPAPGTYNYITGDSIFFGSQANPGYRFLKWEITLGGQTQEFGPQYANGYYVLANSWMSYGTVSFKAFFEAGNPDSVAVTYAVNDPAMGTTTPAPGIHYIYVGNAITATATPNPGHTFDAWIWQVLVGTNVVVSDTINSDNEDFANPINFGTLPQSYPDNNASIIITAVFSEAPVTNYTVTLVSADASMGTVSPAGANTVEAGSTFTATATANPDYHFVAWKNGDTQVSTSNPYTFTVNEDITLTAVFEYNIGINEFDLAKVNVYSTNSTIIVNGAQNQDLAVYDMTGRCIYQHANANEIEKINVLSAGTYLVKINNNIAKKVVVLK